MSEKADISEPSGPEPGPELAAAAAGTAALALVAEKLGEFTADLATILEAQHDQATAHELDRHSQGRHRLLLVALISVAIVLGAIGVVGGITGRGTLADTHRLVKDIENVINPGQPGYQANLKAQQNLVDRLDHCSYVEAWAADHGQPEPRC